VADLGAAEGSEAGCSAAASEVGLPVAASEAGYQLVGLGVPVSVAAARWLWLVSAAERSWGVRGGPGAAGAVPEWFDPVGVYGRAGAAVGVADVGQMQMLVGSGAVGLEDDGDGDAAGVGVGL
jgi:hypothetical protein